MTFAISAQAVTNAFVKRGLIAVSVTRQQLSQHYPSS
jgi:hypothetical protein